MASMRSLRLFTLVQKEVQEYKFSLVWTPLIIAGVLSVLMLLSVLLANRITAMGDTFLQVVLSEEMAIHPVVTINIDDEDDPELQLPAPPAPPLPGEVSDMEVETLEQSLPEEEWNFSREWRFDPQQRDKPEYESEEVGSLNPALQVMHGFMLIVLVLVTVNYLLGCLYNDRRDRSILFWKSMPVSEWQEVLTRLGVALVVAPAVYIGVSLLLQLVFILLAMLLVWRMDMDPFVTILANIRFGDLLLQQIGGWIITALWVAPTYGWLMLASAWARRAPFLVAIAPVLALMLVEGLWLGTNFVLSAVVNHIPHYVGGESVAGFYFSGLYWQQFDLVSLFSGLVFAAATVVASVYLRRYRFEI